MSRARRLDPADQTLELIVGFADVLGQALDHFERLLRLPDLDQLVDEILVRLQRPQQLGEFLARRRQLLGGPLGLGAQPCATARSGTAAPPAGSACPAPASRSFSRAWVSAARRAARPRRCPTPRRAPCRPARAAPRSPCGPARHWSSGRPRRVILDPLVELRDAVLELLELPGEFLDRRDRVGRLRL